MIGLETSKDGNYLTEYDFSVIPQLKPELWPLFAGWSSKRVIGTRFALFAASHPGT